MGETRFGHYRLDRLLGSGGTGQVWLARDTVADRDVALKVLAATHAADPTYRLRFTREARLAAHAPGPHMVPIHTFGELDGRLYIEMEFIEGTDVAALLRRDGPMSPAKAVAIIGQTAAALDAAHRAGLVHRDVKPSNIMVSPGGFVRLIDFGIALRIDQPAITAHGNVVGTLAYMAPERFSGSTDARADQYSLACVLYECLTGERPFGNIDTPQQFHAHLMSAPPRAATLNPAVPVALDDVIARAMAKAPTERWPSAGEFASAAYAAVTGREASTVEIAAVTVPNTRALPEGWQGVVDSQWAGVAESRSVAAAESRGAGAAESWAVVGSPGVTAVESGGAAVVESRGVGATRLVGGFVGEPMRVAEPCGGGEVGWGLGPGHAAAAIAVLVALIGLGLWLGRPGGAETTSAAPSSARPTPTLPGPALESLPAESAHAAVPNASTPVAGQPCNPDVDGNAAASDGTPLTCRSVGGHKANWMPAPPSGAGPRPNGEQSASGPAAPGTPGTSDLGTDKPSNGKPGHRPKPAK
ncbi:protein kinase domain-containing protein [Nocardia nepalensis]|uniref:serine/threonine-protein kinase n=1 Tax=Nocardia nepalensis TaxID=3375448 RepID=UPI003B67AF8C